MVLQDNGALSQIVRRIQADNRRHNPPEKAPQQSSASYFLLAIRLFSIILDKLAGDSLQAVKANVNET
jgi:hypothetical protein